MRKKEHLSNTVPYIHPINLWGPYILCKKVDISFTEKLLVEGRKLNYTNDWSHKLAGHLNKQLAYNIESWISNGILPYINMWVDGWNFFSNLGFSAKSASLESIWINFQNSGDFNPEHTHGGADLSFVIYLKVPDIIKKSYNNFLETPKNRDCPPGAISFSYGEYNKFAVNGRHICPEENMIYMFPSFVRHQVAAFYEDAQRISVAGNITFLD